MLSMRTAFNPSTMACHIFLRVLLQAEPLWGCMIALSSSSRGCTAGKGSGSVTSRAAARIFFSRRAATSASVLITAPVLGEN